MKTRQEIITYCLTYQNVYEDYPFSDTNWTCMRHHENHKIFAWIFERNGSIWVNVKGTKGWLDFFREKYKSVVPFPDFSVSRYDPNTGEVYGYAPDYDALEAAKAPAVQATAPGEYSYCYEMQQAPTGCDYAADLAYYGKHYFLRPLRDGLPPLHGRGITYDAEQGTYMVTLRAYDKIKAQYKIKRETCLD